MLNDRPIYVNARFSRVERTAGTPTQDVLAIMGPPTSQRPFGRGRVLEWHGEDGVVTMKFDQDGHMVSAAHQAIPSEARNQGEWVRILFFTIAVCGVLAAIAL